jgi:hypothetical protein
MSIKKTFLVFLVLFFSSGQNLHMDFFSVWLGNFFFGRHESHSLTPIFFCKHFHTSHSLLCFLVVRWVFVLFFRFQFPFFWLLICLYQIDLARSLFLVNQKQSLPSTRCKNARTGLRFRNFRLSFSRLL